MPGCWRYAVLLVVSSLAACDESAELDRPSNHHADALWSGCSLLDDERGCQLTKSALRVWLEDEDSVSSWTLDAQPIEPETEPAAGGLRSTFGPEMIRRGGQLAAWTSDSAVPVFEIRILPNPLDPSSFDFGDAVIEARDASLGERRRVAEALRAESASDPLETLARLHHARALEYDESDPSGSASRAIPALEKEAQLAAEQGLWGVRCNAALALLFFASRREELESVERWRGLETECRARSAGRGAEFDQHAVTHAMSMGRYAEAETRLDRLVQVVERIQPEASSQTAFDRMTLYARTGRRSEVRRELEALRASSRNECDRAERESWIGYAKVRALQGGHEDLGDPRPGLRDALRAHRGLCQSVAWETYDWLKLGYASALMDDLDGLAEAVEQLEPRTLERKQRRQLVELKLEHAVAERRFDDAAELSSRLETLLRRGEPEARWRFRMILAKSAELQGDLRGAERAYVAAEAVLDDLWSDVKSGTLRAHWLASYRRSATELMRTRLELDDLDGAACAARIARARALHPTGSSQLVCGRPWTRTRGELVFFVVPESARAWLVFEIDERGVRRASSVPAPSDRVEGWWDAWDDTIDAAERVRVLASGHAIRHALHRERWRGRPLNEGRPVTFGLDLPSSEASPRPEKGALVLFSDSDPYRALARYAPGVQQMHETLVRRGWSSRWADSAGPLELSDALPLGGLFVYYGHGERVDLQGRATLTERTDLGSTALRLDGGAHWGVEDVSKLNRVPRAAVLLGCDVGFPDPETWTGGLNLAHSLLLAGTEEVLAATGPVDAASATRVGVELLAAEPSSKFTLSRALHEVWRASPDSPDDSSLGLFRVWSR